MIRGVEARSTAFPISSCAQWHTGRLVRSVFGINPSDLLWKAFTHGKTRSTKCRRQNHVIVIVPIRNGFLWLGDSSRCFRSTRCQQTPVQTVPPSLPFRLPPALEGDPLCCEKRLHLWPLAPRHFSRISHQLLIRRNLIDHSELRCRLRRVHRSVVENCMGVLAPNKKLQHRHTASKYR